MSEMFQPNEIRDLPAVQFRSAGVVYEPSPAPTATLVAPDNSTSSLTLTKQGSTTTTRYLVEDFTQAQAGQYEIRYVTTDANADTLEFVEYVTVTGWFTDNLATTTEVVDELLETELVGNEDPDTVAGKLNAGALGGDLSGIEDQLDDIEDLLTAPFNVSYTNPVNPYTQDLEMWLDDDYTILSGRDLANWVSDEWLTYDLKEALWTKFYYVDKFNTEIEIGTVHVENDNKTLYAEFSKAEKLDAKLIAGYEYTYKVRTKLDLAHGDDEITLVVGNLNIKD